MQIECVDVQKINCACSSQVWHC